MLLKHKNDYIDFNTLTPQSDIDILNYIAAYNFNVNSTSIMKYLLFST